MKNFKKIVAFVLVCALAMTSFAACGKKKTPKETVMDAFATLTAGNSGKALADELGITEIMTGLSEKPFAVGMEFGFDNFDSDEYGVPSLLASSTVKAKISCDTESSKALIDLGMDIADSDLFEGQLYIDEEQFAVAAPKLIDKVFFVEFDNIVDKFEDSVLFEMMGASDEDLDMLEELFDSMEKLAGDSDAEEMEKFILGFEDEIEAFKKDIEVEEIEGEKFEINGKERKCDGYELVITEESIVEFAEAAIDYFLLSDDAKDFYERLEEKTEEIGGVADLDDLYYAMEEIEGNKKEVLDMIEEAVSDIEAEFYIYEGEIVFMEAETEIANPDNNNQTISIGIELECTGGKYSVYDNYELGLKVMGMKLLGIVKEAETDGDEYSATWEVTGAAFDDMEISASFELNKKDGDFEASVLVADDDTKIEVTSEGAIEVEKKKSVKVVFDEISVDYNDYYETYSISYAGEFYVEKDADVSMPKGEKFDLLTTKESDWEALREDIEDVMDKLQDLDLGFAGEEAQAYSLY